jgi:hypothetical protein
VSTSNLIFNTWFRGTYWIRPLSNSTVIIRVRVSALRNADWIAVTGCLTLVQGSTISSPCFFSPSKWNLMVLLRIGQEFGILLVADSGAPQI